MLYPQQRAQSPDLNKQIAVNLKSDTNSIPKLVEYIYIYYLQENIAYTNLYFAKRLTVSKYNTHLKLHLHIRRGREFTNGTIKDHASLHSTVSS